MIDVFSNGDDMRDIDQSNMEQDRVKSVDSKLNSLIEKLNYKISLMEARLGGLESKQLYPRDDFDEGNYYTSRFAIGDKVKVQGLDDFWIVEAITFYDEYIICNLISENRTANLKVNEAYLRVVNP
jgi:hypothetical protein